MSSKELKKNDLRKLAYRELLKIVKDPTTSAAVRVQALTQITKIADSLPEVPETDELEAFLNETDE